MQENVRNEIKNKLKISDVVSRSVSLIKKSESRYIALCPFHKEKTPSFNVLDDKGFYHCFGCGKHGDIFSFVMEMENLNFKEALKDLSKLAGIHFNYSFNEKNEELYKILIDAKDYFIVHLKGKDGEIARKYLQKRKIDLDSVEEFCIGFAPPINIKPSLIDYLLEKGYGEEQIIKSGIGKINSRNNFLQSYFLNRLVIPIISSDGRIVGFGARVLDDSHQPKYLNSAENEIFKKRNILYGAYNLKKNYKKDNFLLICEGYMDVISLRKYGFSAVASLGTSITDLQIEQSLNLSDNIYVVFDGDEAGKNATLRFFEKSLNLLKLGKKIRYVFLSQKLDPEEYIIKNGLEAFNNKLKKGLNIADMIWFMGLKLKKDNEPETNAKFWTFIRQKSNLIKHNELKIAIKDELEKRIRDLRYKNREIANQYQNKDKLFYNFKTKLPEIGIDLRYKAILSLIICYPKLLNTIEKKNIKIQFKNSKLDEIKIEILKISSLMPNISSEELKKSLANKGYGKVLNDFNFNSILSRFPINNEELNFERCKLLLEELIFMVNKTKFKINQI